MSTNRKDISAALKRKIMERDEWTCVLCGRPAEHVDHIIPVAAGGSNAEDNLRALCRDCNLKKGARVLVRTLWFNRKYLDHV